MHRDYKRVKAASGDESREKLNKSRGGGGRGRKSQMYIDENIQFLSIFVAFMTMMRTDIDYDGKYVVAF